MSNRFTKEQIVGMVEQAWEQGYAAGRDDAMQESDRRGETMRIRDDTVKNLLAAKAAQQAASAKKSKATK